MDQDRLLDLTERIVVTIEAFQSSIVKENGTMIEQTNGERLLIAIEKLTGISHV